MPVSKKQKSVRIRQIKEKLEKLEDKLRKNPVMKSAEKADLQAEIAKLKSQL